MVGDYTGIPAVVCFCFCAAAGEIVVWWVSIILCGHNFAAIMFLGAMAAFANMIPQGTLYPVLDFGHYTVRLVMP